MGLVLEKNFFAIFFLFFTKILQNTLNFTLFAENKNSIVEIISKLYSITYTLGLSLIIN